MLVLSQCRMADGVPSSGDGVYGTAARRCHRGRVKTFRRPFVGRFRLHRASFDDSLLQRRLSLGRGRADALRSAMLEVMRTPEQKGFLYWAPVILTGDPRPLAQAIVRAVAELLLN